MRALTSLDSMFLATEDGRTVANVSSLAIIDRTDCSGKALTRNDIQDLLAERLHLLPPLRWRLAPVPFGLGHPWWVDGEVDLDFHVRETAVVAPGDRAALETLVARLTAHPMDRSRPLWEIYLIQGLRDDRGDQEEKVAVLTKLHHAAVDGLSGGEVLNLIYDTTSEGRDLAPAPRYRPEPEPGTLGMLARTMIGMPQRQWRRVGAVRRALTHLDEISTLRPIPGIAPAGRLLRCASTVVGARSLPGSPVPAAPRLGFNGPISPHRRVALTSLALDSVKEIKSHFEATVNDVVVALCTGALRRWLDERGELPEQPLVAAIPVSTRGENQMGTCGNKVGSMVVGLPTTEADPVIRLQRCRAELRAAKLRNAAVPDSLMDDALDVVPTAIFDPAIRAMTTVAAHEALAPAANVVISNVPGARAPLYCAGHRVHEHYPISTISDSLGLNVTVFSYTDRLEIGVVADRYTVADLPGLAGAFDKELHLLLQTVQRPEEVRS